MNEVDWVIAVVLLLSTGVGVSRGVIREILAIVGWVLGIVLALRFSPVLADAIPLTSVSLIIRTVIAALIIVAVTLFVIALLGKILARLLSGVSFEDRAIGCVFGFVRGVVIVCACVFLFGMTSVVKSGYWRNSVLIVPAERVIDFVMPYLPETIAQMRRDYRVH